MKTETVFFTQPANSFQPNAAFLAAIHLLHGVYFPSAKVQRDGNAVTATEDLIADSTVNTFTIVRRDSGCCVLTHEIGDEQVGRHWVRFDEIEPDRIECVRYHPLVGESRMMIKEVDAPVMVDLMRSMVGLKLTPEVKHTQPIPMPGAPPQEDAAEMDPAKAQYRQAKLCFAEAISALKAVNFPRKTTPAHMGDPVTHQAEFSLEGVRHEVAVTHAIEGVKLTHLKVQDGVASHSTFQVVGNGRVDYTCRIGDVQLTGCFPPGETNITDLLKRSISGKLPGIRVTQVLRV